MSLIKCPECGKEVSEHAKVCPNCGYPIPEIKEVSFKEVTKEIDKTKNRKEKKKPAGKILAIVAGIIIIIVAVGYFATTNMRVYSKATALYNDKKYEDALEIYYKIENYKDSRDRIIECEKLLAIQNDKTAPVIEYTGDGSVIEVKSGTNFNLNEFLSGKLLITDDVTKNITEYSTKCDKKIYDNITGNVETGRTGEYPVKLSAKDEAGNEGTCELTLKIEPIRVTKEEPNPIIYDGEYGTITVKDFKHGYISGKNEYEVLFDVDNRTDKNMQVAMSAETFINDDYQVKTYHTWQGYVSAGKKGVQDSMIYDEDIPEEVGDVKKIESVIILSEGEMEDPYCGVTVEFDVNISNN